jgi:CRP/FNR family transcriptional regulator, cyclic AMP receptor protein
MPPDNKTAFLKTVPIFRDLPAKELDLFGRIVKTVETKKGEVVFTKDHPADAMYVVVKGAVKIFSTSRMGKIKTFAYLGPRDFFGEMALLVKGARSANAVSLTPASLLVVHRADFQALLKSRPKVVYALLQALCQRLIWADKEIESLSFNSVLGQVAHILLSLAARYGKKTPRGTLIQLELSHQELADLAGTAREVVTRVLTRFSQTKCLEMDGKFYVLTDPVKLKDWTFS